MKIKKSKKVIISILVIVIMSFIAITALHMNEVYAVTEEEIYEPVNAVITALGRVAGGILLIPIQYLLLALAYIAQVLLTSVLSLGSAIASVPDAAWVGMDQILFHDQAFRGIKLVSIDFFDFTGGTTLNGIISRWYYIIRTISIAALLVVLVYVAIRIIIASTGEAKSKYKSMLKDWAVALALNFIIHFIMAGIVAINNALVQAIWNMKQSMNEIEIFGFEFTLDPIIKLIGAAAIPGIIGFLYTMAYVLLLVFIIRLLIIYINRMVTLAFLTVMGPILTITYPLEKMNGGKAKGFSFWLKDYIFNVLIQVFDCLIYVLIIEFALNQIYSNPLLGLALIGSIFPLRKWVAKAFGFDQASTIGNAAATMGGALAFAGLGAASMVSPAAGMAAAGTMGSNLKNASGDQGKIGSSGNGQVPPIATNGKPNLSSSGNMKKVSSPDSGSWQAMFGKIGSGIGMANPLNAVNGRWAQGMQNYEGKGKGAVNFAGRVLEKTGKTVLPMAGGIISMGMDKPMFDGVRKGDKYNKEYLDNEESLFSGTQALTAAAMKNRSKTEVSQEGIKQQLEQAIEKYRREEMTDKDKEKLNITIQAAISGKDMPENLDKDMQQLYNTILAAYQTIKAEGYDDDDAKKITEAMLNSTIENKDSNNPEI